MKIKDPERLRQAREGRADNRGKSQIEAYVANKTGKTRCRWKLTVITFKKKFDVDCEVGFFLTRIYCCM